MASFPAVAVPQEERTETVAGRQGIENNGVHYSEQSKSQSIRFPSDEVSSSGDEFTTKVRKPYTITKQRERWTEEEHHKFLEALKMHGRAWRRIEEHIGTKTAVQIRSHAQKFFSKLEREASAGGVPMGKAQDISIPPPRPKRKPSHPYPRKAGTASQIGPSTNEEENRSLSAVSSAPDRLCAGSNLGGETQKNAAFAPYNARLRPLQTHDNINLQETNMESSSTSISPSSLKLFGQTVLVPTNESGLDVNVKGAFQEFKSHKMERQLLDGQIPESSKLEKTKGSLHSVGVEAKMKVVKSENASGVTSNIPASESGTSMLEGSGESNANLPCREIHTAQQDSDEPLSELDNNMNSLSREHQASVPISIYSRHIPVQNVEGEAEECVAINTLNGNGSLSDTTGKMKTDVQTSQLNVFTPFPGMPGSFNPAYNNLERFGCIPGFIAPGTAPNGSFPPWHLTPSAALHHPAYAAATLAAAAFWPGLVSGASPVATGDPQPPREGKNGHSFGEDTSAMAAVTAATVAAASAWWTLHGAIPPPFLHPGIYGPVVAAMAAEAAAVAAAAAASGSSSPLCKTGPVREARKHEKMITTEEDGEILDAMPTSPSANTKGKLSMEQLDDGIPGLSCPKSGHADGLPEVLPSSSDPNITSCNEESCDVEMQIEKPNCQVEEQDDNAFCINLPDGETTNSRKVIKETSSSGSNTPSSADPEVDPCLGMNTEVKGNSERDFEFNWVGSGSSDAGGEEALASKRTNCILPETLGKTEREKNNLSTKQDGKVDYNGNYVNKDRYQSYGGDAAGHRSKSGGHLNETWREVSQEGRIAFEALFNQDVLPQSFSHCQNLRDQDKVPKVSRKSFCNDAKQKPSKTSRDEIQDDAQNMVVNQKQACSGVHAEDCSCAHKIALKPAGSPTQVKKIQDSEATDNNWSLEKYGESERSLLQNKSVAVDFKPSKSSVISSSGNFRSGRGFVPYQRCSIEAKKNRLHTRPTQNCQDDEREEKRVRLKQEVEDG